MNKKDRVSVSVVSEDGKVRSLGTTKSMKDFMKMVCLSNTSLRSKNNPDILTIIERV